MKIDKNYRPIFRGVMEEKSFSFARDVISLCNWLKEQRMYEISSQLVRSGTSVGANIAEAGYASSRKDFINKLKISSKEANETLYWLLLLKELDKRNDQVLEDLISRMVELRALLLRSIRTADKAE